MIIDIILYGLGGGALLTFAIRYSKTMKNSPAPSGNNSPSTGGNNSPVTMSASSCGNNSPAVGGDYSDNRINDSSTTSYGNNSPIGHGNYNDYSSRHITYSRSTEIKLSLDAKQVLIKIHIGLENGEKLSLDSYGEEIIGDLLHAEMLTKMSVCNFTLSEKGKRKAQELIRDRQKILEHMCEIYDNISDYKTYGGTSFDDDNFFNKSHFFDKNEAKDLLEYERYIKGDQWGLYKLTPLGYREGKFIK